MQNTVYAQLEKSLVLWQQLSVLPEDLTPSGFPGLTRQAITDSIAGMLVLVESLNKLQDFEPTTFSLSVLQVHLNNLNAYVSSNIPSNPLPHIPGFLQVLDTVQRILLEWVDLADPKKAKIAPTLVKRLAEAVVKINDAETVYNAINARRDEASEAANQVGQILSKMMIDANDSEALTLDAKAKTKLITDTAQIATTEANTLTSLLTPLKSLKAEVETAMVTQQQLFVDFEGYRDTIDKTLGDANRVSMAGAFIDRRNTYEKPLELWTRIFFGALLILILMAVWVVIPFFSYGSWRDTLLRLPLSAPAIWMAWFAAKQFGYLSRLREDYAFKAAAAMAFEGYKREAVALDVDLHKKLLDTAITHLGDNPIRIYNNVTEHVSPFNEFLENNIKDETLMKSVVDIINALKK